MAEDVAQIGSRKRKRSRNKSKVRKRKALASKAVVAVSQSVAAASHSYSFKIYDKRAIQKNPSVVPEEYLSAPIVCGEGQVAISARDMRFIDNAVLLVAYVSPSGSSEATLIGCRQVAYFAPLDMIVLNTTVIFGDGLGQKNLDPIQKMTSDYIRQVYPSATRAAVVTSEELSPANWMNYTTNGFPWRRGGGSYDYLPMVNIDDLAYASGEHDAGQDEAWKIWDKGKMHNYKGYLNCVSGGYGQHGCTLVAMIPRG